MKNYEKLLISSILFLQEKRKLSYKALTRAFVRALKFSEVGQRRISWNKMSAFDLGECLHDPEFAPSRKGLANRFSAVHPRSSHVYANVHV